MSDNGDNDDYDPSQPLPPSQFFGGGGADGGDGDDGDDGDLPPQLAAALDGLNEDGDFDKMPEYASDANKALNTQLVAKEKKLQQKSDELAENTERVAIMTDHLRNVEQEHLHTQALVDAKKRETTTEEHLNALAERERGRVSSDVKKVNAYMLQCQDQLNSYQNAMFSANEKLEQFKLQMNWNQEELLQWSLAAKQKDEDRAALEKYEQVDSQKIKALTLKMEKAAKALQDKKIELEGSVTESQAVQIELDKTAEQYRELHTQRQDLIKQWNDAVSAMMNRDMDIARVGETIRNYKTEGRDKERVLKEEKQFLQSEEVNNQRLKVNLGTAVRTCQSKRELFMNQQKEMSDFDSEVAAQRNELEKAESELLGTHTMNENLENMKEEKIRQMNEYRHQLDLVKEKLATEYETTDDLQARSKQVDALNSEHALRLKNVVKSLQNLKEEMFKHSHELYNLRKKEADLIAEISGAQGTSRNLQARIHELDQRSLKQQEMLYNIEFQVQQMERKVSHASGKRSLEETIELNEEIARLQLSLEEHVAQNKMILNQVKRLHDDLRAAKRKYDDAVAEKGQLTEKLSEIELENDSTSTEVKTAMKKKEETIVAHDVLRLEVKRLRDLLNTKADEVLGLENRKLQLELSMAERQKEVALHQDVQKAEHKAAEEQRHNLAMDLKERQIKVDKLKNKFSVIAGKLQSEDGEEKSQAYFIIQAAQHREELQREGDELNTQIRKAEKEIRMMARTLQHLGQRNNVYRESFQKADPNGPDAKLKGDLEEQHRSVADSLYKKKSYMREIATDYEERKRILGELGRNLKGMVVEVREKDQEIQEVNRQIKEQEEELTKASRTMMEARDEFRKAKNITNDDSDSIEELQISLLEQKRKNRVMLNLLRHFTEEQPGMTDAVGQTLADVGLRLSQRPGSSGSTASRPGVYSSSRRGGRPDSANTDLPPISPGMNGRGSRPNSGSR